jgi:prepilin-type N-terminal cleavage/methylation domain-containing protein
LIILMTERWERRLRRGCHSETQKTGFTLIELSIVLVIIGLVVGGVLVGKDLIFAAQVRRAVSEAESFNTA